MASPAARYVELLSLLKQKPVGHGVGAPGVVHATLAPLLPCDPEELADLALEATGRDLIGDPLHVRAVKRSGATTRQPAWDLASKLGHGDWFEPGFQRDVAARIAGRARAAGRRFGVGPEAFRWLVS